MKLAEVITACEILHARLGDIVGSQRVQVVVQVQDMVFDALRSSKELVELSHLVRGTPTALYYDTTYGKENWLYIKGTVFVPCRVEPRLTQGA